MNYFEPLSELSVYDINNWQLWKQKFQIFLKATGKERTVKKLK